jgi:hypothetical protein
VIAAVCLLAFGDIAYFVFSQGIPLLTVDSPIIFPFLIDLVLLISLIMVIAGEMKKSSHEKGTDKDEPENIKDLIAVAAYFAGTAAYILVLKNLHFLTGTIIYMLAIMYLLHEAKRSADKVVKILIPCLITVPAVYFVFSGIFHVILP